MLQFTAQQIAIMIQGLVDGDPTAAVNNFGKIEEAKKVCNRCVVKDACLAWALESGQDAGVWGGLSEDERRALKRRAARNRARMMEQNNNLN